MKENKRDEISENALLIFLLMKRLFSGDPANPALASLKNQTYHVLRILERKGPLPVSAIGKELFIAKQNMTTLIDKLMNDGLVERKSDSVDRRIVQAVITDKGRESLKERRSGLKKIVGENLAKLGDDDIEALHRAFGVIRTVVDKLQ